LTANELLQVSSFTRDMEHLFKGKPSGLIRFLTLSDAMGRIKSLQSTVERLQRQIDALKRNTE